MKSPPGGGMRASPKRANSGPASKNEARIRSESTSSGAVEVIEWALRRSSLTADHSAPHPDALEHRDLRLRVTDPGHVGQHHLLVGEQAGGEDRQRRVLVAGSDDLPESGGPPWMTNFSIGRLG